MAGAKHTAPLGGITGAVIENGERFLMKTLAKRYPSVDAVLAELANLEAVLTLPSGSRPIRSCSRSSITRASRGDACAAGRGASSCCCGSCRR